MAERAERETAGSDAAPEDGTRRTRARRFADWYFRHPDSGEVVLGQRPNATIVLVFGLKVADLVLPGRVYERGSPVDLTVKWLGTATFAWWSLDELLRGDSPYRRTIGLLSLATAVRWAPGVRTS